MPLVHHALNRRAVVVDVRPVLPVEEERRLHPRGSKRVQDGVGERERPIVKGEGDGAGDRAAEVDLSGLAGLDVRYRGSGGGDREGTDEIAEHDGVFDGVLDGVRWCVSTVGEWE